MNDAQEGRTDELLGPIRKMLARFLRSEALERGDLDTALAQLTETSAVALGVARASVWRYGESRSSLECLDLFELRERKHSAGQLLRASDTPAYFRALAEERTIAAHDACRDPRTTEFEKEYLIPHVITSMLDAPIFVDGHLAGVFCLEHIGAKRRWQSWEELVAGTLADFVAMVLGAVERNTQASALEDYRARLEHLVEERTRQLEQSEKNFRKIFETAPIALVMSRLNDRTVVAANPPAAHLFGVAGAEVVGQPADEYWVDPEERRRIVQDALGEESSDLVDHERIPRTHQVQLKDKQGRTFWGHLSVRAMTVGTERHLLFGVRDATEEKNAQDAIAQSRENLRTLFDAAPTAMLLVNAESGKIRLCNQRAADLFETTSSAMIGTVGEALAVDESESASLRATLSTKGFFEQLEMRLRTTKGREFWGLASAKSFMLESEPVYMVGVVDVTEQKRTESRLYELATTDSLTGLLNRRRLLEVAEEEVARAERYGRPLGLAMFDLDHFKRLNDTYGHACGDSALQAVGHIMRETLRRQDCVGRYGGEEILALLPETSLDSVSKAVERALRTIEAAEIECEGRIARVTASAGVVMRQENETLSSLLRRADLALYRAKDQGRNRAVIY